MLLDWYITTESCRDSPRGYTNIVPISVIKEPFANLIISYDFPSERQKDSYNDTNIIARDVKFFEENGSFSKFIQVN